jgi:diguanylate cyclase (GGDEF)-like protein
MTLRKTDIVARFGGEEFSAFLTDTNETEVFDIMDRIRKKVSDTEVFNPEMDKNASVTVSIGLTRFSPGQSESDVISNADKALYIAKRTRDAVAFFPEP